MAALHDSWVCMCRLLNCDVLFNCIHSPLYSQRGLVMSQCLSCSSGTHGSVLFLYLYREPLRGLCLWQHAHLAMSVSLHAIATSPPGIVEQVHMC